VDPTLLLRKNPLSKTRRGDQDKTIHPDFVN